MFHVIRTSFEVVKDGRILHFVSGYRRFVVRNRKIDYPKSDFISALSRQTNFWFKFDYCLDLILIMK
jgi:hypothetical protein